MRQRFGVVVTPQRDASLMLKGIQACFGYAGVSSIDPHITLVPPFNLDSSELPKVLAALAKAGSTIEPFEVELGSLRSFDSNGDVLYLEVRGGVSQLEEVYCAVMNTGVFREIERAFVPHLTVAIGIGSERTLQAIGLSEPIRLSFVVDTLDVLAKVPGERWMLCASSILGWGSVKNISHLRVSFSREVGVSQGVLDAIEAELDDDISRSTLELLAARDNSKTFSVVIFRESEILGSVIYSYVHAKFAVIDYVVVFDVDNRGFGLGRAAISLAIEILRKDDVSYVFVRSSQSSYLFEQLGFVELNDPFYDELLAKLVTSGGNKFLVRELC